MELQGTIDTSALCLGCQQVSTALVMPVWRAALTWSNFLRHTHTHTHVTSILSKTTRKENLIEPRYSQILWAPQLLSPLRALASILVLLVFYQKNFLLPQLFFSFLPPRLLVSNVCLPTLLVPRVLSCRGFVLNSHSIARGEWHP